MDKLRLVLSTIALAALSTASARAMTEMQAITRLLSSPNIKAEWFSPDVLTQIPLATLAAQIKTVTSSYGAFIRIDTLEGRPLAIFERGTLIVTTASLDDQGRLTGFGALPGPAPVVIDPAAVQAKKEMAAAVLEDLFRSNPSDLNLFSQMALEEGNSQELLKLLDSIREHYGNLQTVQITNSGYQMNFDKGVWGVSAISLDDNGLITNLSLQPIEKSYATLAEARSAYVSLPGQVSLLVQELGQVQPLLDLNSSKLLAVGSTFKLAILSELQAQINRRDKTWSDEVVLTDDIKSLPGGTLQDAPTGSRYTLRDLAARMISMSDNTATDLLLKAVGRAGVEARLGQTALPSTREAFVLKDPANIELLRAYRSAGLDRNARRVVLKQAAARPLPDAKAFAQGKTAAQDVEWFANPRRLCHLMADVAALPETQLNPGILNTADFKSISYKGGSEIGVLNLTTQITTKSGRTLCISATWNRPEPLDEQTFFVMYAGLLKLLN